MRVQQFTEDEEYWVSGSRESWSGGAGKETYGQSKVAVSPGEAFAPVRRIGGRTGWYFGNWLWRIRGLLDLMTGGVGMRRGRPDPETPLHGSTLDFWRVQIYEPGGRLRLLAEMRVPRRAWLEFHREGDGPSEDVQEVWPDHIDSIR